MLPSGPERPKKDESDSSADKGAAFSLFRSDELQSVDNGDGWLEDNEDNNIVSLLIIIGLLLIIVFTIPNRLPFRQQTNDDASILLFFFYSIPISIYEWNS